MPALPEKPGAPILLGMSHQENSDWLQAHNWAYVSIVAARNYVMGLKNADAGEYNKWFEAQYLWTDQAAWERRRRIVESSLTRMAERMAFQQVTYKKSNDAKACLSGVNARAAYTKILNGSGEIGLCPSAFNDDWLRLYYFDSAAWARAVIIVHEMYHLSFEYDKERKKAEEQMKEADSRYLWSLCYLLANFDPDLAIKNAQNYAYFVMGSLWTRRAARPDWPEDCGIWSAPTPGAGWRDAAAGPAATATTHTQNVVMVAYPELGDEGTAQISANDGQAERVGRRLLYRMLLLDGDQQEWTGPYRLQHVGNPTDRLVEMRSAITPALDAWGQEFHCAWVDHESGKLLYARTDASAALRTRNWSDLRWSASGALPDQIASHVASLSGVALAVYRPDEGGPGNQSRGVYCVYYDPNNADKRLICSVLLDKRRGGWIEAPFDRPRSTMTPPALAIFNGELKCAYHDRSSDRMTILTYRPKIAAHYIDDPQPGTWFEEQDPILASDRSNVGWTTVALGQWNSPKGATLAAVGVERSAKQRTSKENLSFSMTSREGGWKLEESLPTLTTGDRPALASCGPRLFLFYRDLGGAIQARQTV